MAVIAAKRKGEIIPVVLDFSPLLHSGETLIEAGGSVGATVYSGRDSNPAAILLGLPLYAPTKITQRVQEGVIGILYRLSASYETSAGRQLSISALLALLPDELPATGTRVVFLYTSAPFPIYEYFSEVLGVTVALPEAELRKVIDEYEWSDAARILVSLPEAELRSIVVTREISDALTIEVSLPEAELKSVVITLERPVDPMFISVALPEAELKKIGITYEPPREDFQITVDLPEAELALA